jgi:hypothetical protein
MIVLFAGASALLSLDKPALAGAIAALGAVGIAYIVLRVPTRERVLAERQAVVSGVGAAAPTVTPADPAG